jgi:hypothetical protein
MQSGHMFTEPSRSTRTSIGCIAASIFWTFIAEQRLLQGEYDDCLGHDDMVFEHGSYNDNEAKVGIQTKTSDLTPETCEPWEAWLSNGSADNCPRHNQNFG